MEPAATNPPPGSRPRRDDTSAPLIAVCSSEALTDAPAGPALRAAGIARGLASHGLQVVLVAPSGSRAPEGCTVAPLDDVHGLVESGATMIASGFLLERHPALADAAHLVVDAAGPFLLENLVIHQHEDVARRRRVLTDESAVFARLCAAADLVLFAHERQRDLMFGMMLASGSLLPQLIDADPSLDSFFLSVPFGPTDDAAALPPPTPSTRLRLVWPGGLWDWLDPVCLVEAVAAARAAGADVGAELWGARSPDPLVPPPRAAGLVSARARELGVADVIEIVDWVPYADRRRRLAWAHAAVTLDQGGIEARYAFRTRLVDALAAGVPVIATAGEHVADEAARRGGGFTVPPGDHRALAALLHELCAEPSRLERARRLAPPIAADWAYERTVAPLAAWCRAPRRVRAGLPAISRESPSPAMRRVYELRERLRRTARP